MLGLVGALRKQVEGALQQPQSPFLMDSDNGFKVFDTQRFLAVVKKLAENDRSLTAENLAQEFVKRGNQQNTREVTANLQRQTGVDLQGFLGNSPALLEKVNLLTTANTQLIKSISNQYLDKVQTAVTQSVMTGKLNADLAKEIRQIGNVTESRARLIARDQSSKLNATLTQVRYQDVGIKKYRWSTSGDERVRTSHAENDGKIFSYDDPPETGHPGHEINCRCVQIPVLDEKAERENKQVGKWDMLSSMEQQVLEKSPSIADSTKGLMAGLKERKVEVKPVQLLKKQLSGSEIIQKLAGGDETKGSCASLALAYIGNRLGLDVTDYRDGESRSFFSNALNFRKLVTTQGVKSAVFEVVREAKDVATLLEKELVLGKEYILGAGKHAAIVRKTENGLEYLEMQLTKGNGWKSFAKEYGTVVKGLQKRFGCSIRPDKYGFKSRVELAEVDSFKSIKTDMRAILGYLNTATNKQKKGNLGGAK
ncbi:phage Mu protein gp30-like protein [Canicola haemoglobinophilus]|uniref:Phage Mu protein gp30-like protein n=1 Tax=Canicola haemoglobinophilus TaxID=733 RepID=A0A377HW24_9PAST|nr:phage Mu protein gp30-like protein [Canicola haemoglobinophilus]